MIRKIIAILALCFTLVYCNCAFAITYKDVKPEDNFYSDITKLSNMSILFGYPDGYYRPYNYLTRAEFTSIVVRALGLLDKPYEETEYTDLDKNHWAYKYIQIASFYSLVKGVPNGNFKPNDPVTRLEVIAVISNALEKKDLTIEDAEKLLNEYKDANLVPSWAKLQTALAINYDLLVLSNEGNDYISPLNNATRAEVAGFINKMLIAFENAPSPKIKEKQIGIRLFRGDTVETAYKEGKYTIIPSGTELPLAIIECSVDNKLANDMDFRAKARRHYVTKEDRLLFPASTEFYGKFKEVREAKLFKRNERWVLETVYFINSRTKEEGKITMAAVVEPTYKGKTILDKINYYVIKGKKINMHKSATGNFVLLEPYKVEIIDEYVSL